MKRLTGFIFILAFMFSWELMAQGPSKIAVMASTNGTLLTPTNFFGSNVIAGVGITVSQGAGGQITITGTGTNALQTNFPSVVITNYIFGTNYNFEINTNTPTSILSWEWWTNLSGTLGALGVTNYNGIYVTNLIFGTNTTFASATNVPKGIMTWEWFTNLFSVMGVSVTNNSILTAITNNSAPVTNGVILYVTPSAVGSGIRGREDKPFGLTNAVSAAVNGDTIWLAPGDYPIRTLYYWISNYAGSLQFQNKTNIVLKGTENANIWATNGGTVVMLWAANNILIDGINFYSVKNDTTYLYASNDLHFAGNPYGTVEMIHSENVTFRNCKWIDNWSWAVSQASLGLSFPSTNGIVFDSCTAINCGSSSDTWVDAGGAFHVTPGTVIRDCTIQRCMNGVWFYVPGSVYLPAPVVERTWFVDCNDNSISSDGSHYVLGAVFRNNHFVRSTNLTFSLPYMRTNLNSRHIYVSMWNNEIIEANEFTGADEGWINKAPATGVLNQTNLVIRNNLFADVWHNGIDFSKQLTNYTTRILGNTVRSAGAYGILWTGDNFDTEIRNNTFYDFDLFGLGNYAIGFKLCASADRVTIDNNFIRPQLLTKFGMNFGTNVSNLRLGYNPTFNVLTNYCWVDISGSLAVMTNRYPVQFLNPSYWPQTNGDLLVMLQSPSAYTNQWLTNVLASTNWVGAYVAATAGSASATNAVSTVEIQGTNVVSMTATNISFWQGANVTLTGTNQGNGKASILITAAAGTGGDQYSGGSMVLSNLTGTGAVTNNAWANAVSNRFDGFTTANSNLSWAIGTASTNYASGTANNVSNWVNAVSNRFNTFSGNNSNLSWAIGTASTNYASGTANNVSNWVNAVSNRFDGFTVNNSNLSWAIGTASTNYANSVTNSGVLKNLGTNPPIPGDLLVGTTNSLFYRLAKGTDTQVLKMSGTNVAWGTDATSSGGITTLSNTGVYITNNATVLDLRAGTNVALNSTNLDGGKVVISINAVAGVGTPGGSDFQLQYANGGAFGGAANTGWTNATGTMGASNMVLSGNLYVAGTQSVVTLEATNLILNNVTQGIAYFGAQTNLTNLPFGTGMLTNKGDGTMGWMTIPAGAASILSASGLGTNTTLYGVTNATNMTWAGGRVIYVPTNTTDTIQGCINSASAGDTVVLGSGTYIITTPIVITQQVNIVGQGHSGFVTSLLTPTHGTVISSSSGGPVFRILTNNVRLVNLSINVSGAGATGIDTTNNLFGLIFSDIDVISRGTGECHSMYVRGSDATLRNMTFYCESTDSTAYGLWCENYAGCLSNNVVEAFGVTGITKGSATEAYGWLAYNNNVAKTITLNIYDSVCQTLSGTAKDVGVAAESVTTTNAIVNCYFTTVNGADYDVVVTGTNQVNLGGSVVVNNSISGTPRYRATMVSGAVTTTNLTLLGPGLSYATSASNSPAANELVSAGWVRSLFGSGSEYYVTTNLSAIGTNASDPLGIYTFQSDLCTNSGVRSYTNGSGGNFLVANGYVGSVMTTNTFSSFGGNITINTYIGFVGALGTPSLTIKPEVYYSYDRTNWYGDYSGSYQSITHGATNLYSWVVTFPQYSSTNAAGFYLERRFKVGTISGTGTPIMYLLVGTNMIGGSTMASHVHMQSPSATAGNAYLANNQTFTGSNVFTGGITINGNAIVTNGTLVTASNRLVARLNGIATNLHVHSVGDATTNLILRVDDLATRGAPIMQVRNDSDGAILFNIDNAAQLNANGGGVTNIPAAGNVPLLSVSTNALRALSVTSVGSNGVVYAATNLNIKSHTNMSLSGGVMTLDFNGIQGSNIVGTITADLIGTVSLTNLPSQVVTSQIPRVVGITIDGGGSAITTGLKGFIEVPYACSIVRSTLLADQAGYAGVSIWKTNYANFPPTVDGLITATLPPTLVNSQKGQITTLTGWTTNIAEGDILGFYVLSNATCTRLTLTLKVQP